MSVLHVRPIMPAITAQARPKSTGPPPRPDDIPEEQVKQVEKWRAKFTNKDSIPYRKYLRLPRFLSTSPGKKPHRRQINNYDATRTHVCGQNVNKVNTKVYMRFVVDHQAWLPEYIRERLKTVASSYINKRGELLVISDKTRSQALNRSDCLDKLWHLLMMASELPREADQEALERIEHLQ
ncbi:hypothetical protein EV182_002992, partial [Spiromyces aspiralis]